MKKHNLNKGWPINNNMTMRNLNISTSVHSNGLIFWFVVELYSKFFPLG